MTPTPVSYTCPECDGRCASPFGEHCRMCAGLGIVDETKMDWFNRGKQCKELRLYEGFGMRQYAELNGILPSDLCNMEHGRMDPSPLEATWK